MLSPEVRNQLTATLQRMRADLVAHVRAHGSAPEQDGPPQIGPAAHITDHEDAPVAEMISDDEASLVSRDEAELDKINWQLGRLALGEADICVACGDTIPPERLLANPLADTCLRDQQAIEQRDRLARPGAEPSM